MSTFVKFADVKVGDVLVADGGFTCMPAGLRTVEVDEAGHLFIPCAAGSHYLNGQLNENDELVGLSKAIL